MKSLKIKLHSLYLLIPLYFILFPEKQGMLRGGHKLGVRVKEGH
jgi:hypothetical protein